MDKRRDFCGNKTGQNLSVTGDKVEITFKSDGEIERRGYLLNFTLVSLPTASSGKLDHKETDKTSFSHIWNDRPRFCRKILQGQRSFVTKKLTFDDFYFLKTKSRKIIPNVAR